MEALRILDQTQTVVSSVHRRSASAPGIHSQLPDHRYIMTSIASSAFFTEYCNPSGGFVKCDFDFISPIYQHAKADDILAKMVTTLGISSLARKSKDPSLHTVAHQEYCSVLRMSAEVLYDTESAKSDEMLATVWLLALHEVRENVTIRH